jgi:hypothetical protein
MDYLAPFLVLCSGSWDSPVQMAPPDPASIEFRLHFVTEGTEQKDVEKKLGLECAFAHMVVGNTFWHTCVYSIDKTHELSLDYTRGENGKWLFKGAKIKTKRLDIEDIESLFNFENNELPLPLTDERIQRLTSCARTRRCP